jgi:hypothetical protein
MRCTDLCEACSRHSNLMMETTSTALSHASYARSQTGKIIFPMKDAKDCVFYGGNVVRGLIAFLATTENAGVIHIVCVYVCVCVCLGKPQSRTHQGLQLELPTLAGVRDRSRICFVRHAYDSLCVPSDPSRCMHIAQVCANHKACWCE